MFAEENQKRNGTQRRRLWVMPLCVVAAVYLLALGLLTAFEGKLIFPAPARESDLTPAAEGLAFEDLYVPVQAGGTVHAWWLPAAQPTQNTLLYFHGNAENLGEEAGREAPLLHQTGYNVLLVEYRGFGKSSPIATSGVTTAQDALAALHYVAQQRGIPVAKIVVCGWSIGSAVATQLAVDAPQIAGLVLFSPITSVDDVANQSPLFRYVFRPSQWLRHDNDMATVKKIGSIHRPILLLAGADDQLATPAMAHELYARANPPRKLRMIDGVDHNAMMDNTGGVMLGELKGFLATLPPS